MELRPGLRLRSQVCATEVVVVRGAGDIDLRCGGQPMIFATTPADPVHSKPTASEAQTRIGKRYISPAQASLEVLCTKPGTGALAVGDSQLIIKEPKPLPSSD
jgi:hypothetical protein